MPTFKCKIASPGSQNIIEKKIISDSKKKLRQQLEEDGYFVLQIRMADSGGSLLDRFRFTGRIKTKSFFAFNQEFSVLIRAGMPIVSALDSIIEKKSEDEMNKVLTEVRQDIAAGESLSGAFAKYAHLFSKLYIATLRAGEKSGDITSAIARYLEYMKKTADVRQKVISAAVYPVILTAVSVCTLFFLMVYVVPAFTQSFFDAGAELPAVTLILIRISRFLTAQFSLVILALLTGAALVVYAYHSDGGRHLIDRWKLMLPYIGDIYQHYAAAKLTRTLSTVLSGGTPLLEALRISAGVLGNRYLHSRLNTAIAQIEQGTSFSEALKQTGAFPLLAVRMIHAGESSGALDRVLNDVADFYETDVSTRLTLLTSAIEPGLMVIMGFLIGSIVLAMYMPIFELAGTIS